MMFARENTKCTKTRAYWWAYYQRATNNVRHRKDKWLSLL